MRYPDFMDYWKALSIGDCLSTLSLNFIEPKSYFDREGCGEISHVFQTYDNEGNRYALKCFTSCPPIKGSSYREIERYWHNIDSPYLPKTFRFLEGEIRIHNYINDSDAYYPVVLTDWFDGERLDLFVEHHRYDIEILQKLYINFCRMAVDLRSQPFAHANLSPKNILVDNDCNLRLVGLDTFFVPAFEGEDIPTNGSFGFVSGYRDCYAFDRFIDDFSLVAIALALRLVSTNTEVPADKLEYFSSDEMKKMPLTPIGRYIITHSDDIQIAKLYSLILIANGEGDLRKLPDEIFSPFYEFCCED